MTLYPDTQLLIDNRWCESRSGTRIPVIDPATGSTIGSVASAGEADMEAALASAAQGFRTWSRVGAFDRSLLIRRAASLLRERAQDIARLMTAEEGKPLAEARGEIGGAADVLDWLADEGRRTYGRLVPSRAPDITQKVTRVPVGPVAGFSPWNFPVGQAARKIGAALTTGCSIILKAPEETPASPAALVQTFLDAGLPAGVISLLFGVPSEISERLIPDPVIRKITFTGSTIVGRELAALAGRHMKRATMELGGHAPVIIARDADIESAASLMVTSKFRNAGQVCISPTRFLIERPVYDRFVRQFVDGARALVPGNGQDPSTTMGPLAHIRRVAAMESLVEDARSRGAVIETGGNRIGNAGCFFQPTVLSGLTTDMRAMNEEPFGPLALMIAVDDLDEAVDEAQRLDYGLAAYAFTGSADTAMRLESAIPAGMLSINHLGLALPELPFGGIRDSGYGSEGGPEALEAYMETRLLTYRSTVR